MAKVPLRSWVSPKNKRSLEKEAEKQDRSVSSMIDIILAERYNKKVS